MYLSTEKTETTSVRALVNILEPEPGVLSERIGDENGDMELRHIEVSTATPMGEIDSNVRENIKLKLPRLFTHKQFKQIKGKNKPIALVGGGPSLEDTLNELRDFSGPILACGSSYDYLVKHGIIPDYCAACDPDIAVNNYIQEAHEDTDFLIASCCDPRVFDRLKEYKVYLWHAYLESNIEYIKEHDFGSDVIFGGCTVGLRAINLAIMFGYTSHHLFGFDSCMREDKHHAYDFVEERERLGVPDTYFVKVGKDGKFFKVAGYQLAQAEHFKDFIQAYSRLVTMTFHGEGLLKEVYDSLTTKEI